LANGLPKEEKLCFSSPPYISLLFNSFCFFVFSYSKYFLALNQFWNALITNLSFGTGKVSLARDSKEDLKEIKEDFIILIFLFLFIII